MVNIITQQQLRALLISTLTFMLFGCFGQNPVKIYEKKKKVFTKEILSQNWSEPDKIKSLVESTIAITEGRDIKIGSSKFGGTPDLPENILWPTYKDKPMVFFAQINLKEISDLHKHPSLPKNGVLYFFGYFLNPENEYGAEYEFIKDKSEYKVIYSNEEITKLRKTVFPENLIKSYHFNPVAINFHLQFQIPPTTETWLYENAQLNTNDSSIYSEIISDYNGCEEDLIFGTPCPLQYGADYDWAYSYLNITDFSDPLLKEKIDKVRPKFINLLSFTMNNRFETIGYSNCYFGITLEDLKNKNFDNTVFILQDT